MAEPTTFQGPQGPAPQERGSTPALIPPAVASIVLAGPGAVLGPGAGRALEAAGLGYALVETAAQACEMVQNNPVRVLVWDESLSVAGLPEWRRLWQEDPARPPVYVILLGASEAPGADAGGAADERLAASVDPATFVARVRTGLRVVALELRVRHAEGRVEARPPLSATEPAIQTPDQLMAERTEALEALEAARQQLAEAARRVNLGDMAGTIFRNVGSLLNNSIASATVITEVMQSSRCEALHRLAKLVGQHTGDFGRFVNTDERGQMLPQFILQLNEAIQGEHKKVLERLAVLRDSHEQMRQVLAVRHTYESPAGERQPVVWRELVEDAARLFAESFRRHGIDFEIEEDGVLPEGSVEKAKVMQILMNLLLNAQEALTAMPAQDRRVRVRLRPAEEGMLAIEVSDNGTGIAPEHFEHLSSLGFTTKPNGRGLGLHQSATLARDMGGYLSAKSPGLNRGATFTVALAPQ